MPRFLCLPYPASPALAHTTHTSIEQGWGVLTQVRSVHPFSMPHYGDHLSQPLFRSKGPSPHLTQRERVPLPRVVHLLPPRVQEGGKSPALFNKNRRLPWSCSLAPCGCDHTSRYLILGKVKELVRSGSSTCHVPPFPLLLSLVPQSSGAKGPICLHFKLRVGSDLILPWVTGWPSWQWMWLGRGPRTQ